VDPRLETAIRNAIANGPPARFVALFGSEATGKAHQGSDLDLAWLPIDPAIDLARELEFQVELTRAAGRDVDLVRTDHTSTLTAIEIARNGILLAGDRSAWVRFRAEAMSEFLDFEPALRAASASFRARLAAGGPEATR